MKLQDKHVPLWLIVLLAFGLWMPAYITRALWEPDEARYAYVAQEMRDTGSWAVPQRSGEHYAHKPPLMFWMTNAASLLTGGRINRVSARLPSFLGGILTLWAMTRLLDLWHTRRSAWLSLGILGTAFLFWQTVGTGQIDALLTGLEMTALVTLFAYNRDGALWRPAAAYALMGLAVLAKGPVGFLVPILVYIATTVAGDGVRPLKRWHWAWGPLLTLAFPAAWLAWAWLSGAPESYFNEVLWKQNVARAGGELGHRQGFHYQLWHFPLDFLPWTLLLPAAFIALGRTPDGRVLRRRLTAWAATVILFFSIPSSKRHIYILAAYPAAAMLVAAAWERIEGRAARWGAVAMATLFLLLGGAQLVAAAAPRLPIAGGWLVPGGIATLAGGIYLTRALTRTAGFSPEWFGAIAGTLAAQLLCVSLFVFPAMNAVKTPHALARAAQSELPTGANLLIYRVNGEILAWYCNARGKRIDDMPAMVAEMGRQRTGMAVFPQREWESDAHAVLSPLEGRSFSMGSKSFVWVAFRDLTAADIDGFRARLQAARPAP